MYAVVGTSYIKLASTQSSRDSRTFRSTNASRVVVRVASLSLSPARLPVADCTFVLATADVDNMTTTNSPSEALGLSQTPRATTPPPQHQPIIVPLSPPLTPKRADQSSTPHSLTPRAAMNRAPLHGAPSQFRGSSHPPGGPHGVMPSYSPQDARGGRGAAPAYGLQDARSNPGSPSLHGSQAARGSLSALSTQQASGNFTVQPVGNVGSMKLKKSTVKIVSAATPLGTATPTAASSPAPQPVRAVPKAPERSVAHVAPVTLLQLTLA